MKSKHDNYKVYIDGHAAYYCVSYRWDNNTLILTHHDGSTTTIGDPHKVAIKPIEREDQ